MVTKNNNRNSPSSPFKKGGKRGIFDPIALFMHMLKTYCNAKKGKKLEMALNFEKDNKEKMDRVGRLRRKFVKRSRKMVMATMPVSEKDNGCDTKKCCPLTIDDTGFVTVTLRPNAGLGI